MQGLPAPLTSLLCLPAPRSCQQLCRTGLQVALSHCTTANKEIPVLSYWGNTSFPWQLFLQGNVHVESPMKSSWRSIPPWNQPDPLHFIYFKTFLCRWAVVDIAGVLTSIHKPEVQDDTEQVLAFHRNIFTHRVSIAQAETAQGSTTKWEDHIRTTLKVIFSYP